MKSTFVSIYSYTRNDTAVGKYVTAVLKCINLK